MNETPPPVDELISRHFDEALPLAEHQRLTAALQDDFETRLQFVEVARLHAGLEALAPALPPAKKWHPARWVMAGAAAALMIGGGILFWPQPKGGPVRITLQDTDAKPDEKPEKPKPSGLVRRVVKAPAAASTAEAETINLQNLLQNFFVNISPHGLTVGAAVEKLQNEIRALNLMKHQELDELVYYLGNSRFPNASDPVVCTPMRIPMTVQEYLQICANFRNVTVIPTPNFAKWTPFAGALERTETRDMKARPDFLSMAAEPVAPEAQNWMAEHLKRNYGINVETGESAAFSADSATLTVHAKRWKLDLLEQHLKQLAGRTAQNSYVTGRYLQLPRTALPPDFDEATGLITGKAQFYAYLASLERNPQIKIVASPSILLRIGQQGSIDIGSAAGDDSDKIGLQQSVQSTRLGELIKLDGLIDFRVLEGGEMLHGQNMFGVAAGAGRLPGQVVKHYQTEYEIWLPLGSVGMFLLEQNPGWGQVALVCLSAEIVDPAGVPIPATSGN